MNVLTISVAGARYGLDLTAVHRVLPRPPLRPLPGAPPWVAGVFRLRGEVVPVIDLGVLHGGVPARTAFASRVAVVLYPVPAGPPRLLGLLGDEVTDVLTVDRDGLADPGVALPESPWLGGVASLPAGDLLQVVDVAALLSDDVRARLFTGEERP